MRTIHVGTSCSEDELVHARQLLASSRRVLDPWTRPLLGASADTVREALRMRWARLRQPVLVALRDGLLAAEPTEVVVTREHELIKLSRKHTRGDGLPASEDWFVPPPSGGVRADRALRAVGLASNRSFRSFLANFGGLAERIPPMAGSFIHVRELLTGAQACPSYDEWPPAGWERWREGIVVYHAANGNVALMQKGTGAVAWALHPGESKVKRIAGSFSEFLGHVLRYKRRHRGWPLDAYGP